MPELIQCENEKTSFNRAVYDHEIRNTDSAFQHDKQVKHSIQTQYSEFSHHGVSTPKVFKLSNMLVYYVCFSRYTLVNPGAWPHDTVSQSKSP